MRLWMSAVGVHFGHSAMLPMLAMPENAMRFLADGDAVADGLAVVLHQIEIVVVGIDHDGAGHFLAVIIDDGAAERLGDRNLGVARLGQLGLVRAA